MKLNRKVKKKVVLPTEFVNETHKFTDHSMLLHGFPHIGKTSFISQFEDTYFLSFDSLNSDLRYKASFIKSWEEFVDHIDAVLDSPDFCKYVVVDNISTCYTKCLEYVCNKLGISHPSDLGYGKGWEAVGSEYEKQLFRLLYSDFTLIGVGHTIYKEVMLPDGSKIDKIVPDGTAKCIAFWEKQPDIEACFCYNKADKNKKVLKIRGNYALAADCRLSTHFFYKDTKEPILEIPMGSSPEEGFKNFTVAYNNELPKPKSLINRKS